MSLTEGAPPSDGGQEPVATVITPSNPDAQFSSPKSAAKELADIRWKKHRETQETREPAAPAPAKELAVEAKVAPATEQTSDQIEAIDPVVEEQPSIDPPKSWTAERKEVFKSLPHDVQKQVSEIERSREVEIRRLQNETAEQRKGYESQRQAAEQQRTQYETALSTVLHTLSDQQAGEFADIKTFADLQQLAAQDPFRYQQWDLRQKQIAAVSAEVKAADDRRQHEFQSKYATFVADEDRKFMEKAPEFADPVKAPRLNTAVKELLSEVGFTDQELSALWNGQGGLALRDHRAQLIVRDAVLYRLAKQDRAKAVQKPVPPVLRPGSPPAKSESGTAEIQALEQQLPQQTGQKAMRTAAKILQLKRAAAAR